MPDLIPRTKTQMQEAEPIPRKFELGIAVRVGGQMPDVTPNSREFPHVSETACVVFRLFASFHGFALTS